MLSDSPALKFRIAKCYYQQTEILGNRFGYKKAIEIIADAGFDAFDISLFTIIKLDDAFYGENYLDFARELKVVADKKGIICNQSHAPYPSYLPNDDNFNRLAFKNNVKALKITAALGGKICVIHPSEFLSAKDNAKIIYAPLMPYCKKLGVKVATENIWRWADNGHERIRIPCTGTLPDDYKAI